MWGDPAPGDHKDLTVTYEYNGEEKTETIPEGSADPIKLPESYGIVLVTRDDD